jgi:TFIIF-interacting CTD phosphatase-like protein
MNSNDKIILVLDLDETLIHSERQPMYNKHDFKVFSLYVYQRPNLREFLLEMSEYFSLAVWSAGADIIIYLKQLKDEEDVTRIDKNKWKSKIGKV